MKEIDILIDKINDYYWKNDSTYNRVIPNDELNYVLLKEWEFGVKGLAEILSDDIDYDAYEYFYFDNDKYLLRGIYEDEIKAIANDIPNEEDDLMEDSGEDDLYETILINNDGKIEMTAVDTDYNKAFKKFEDARMSWNYSAVYLFRTTLGHTGENPFANPAFTEMKSWIASEQEVDDDDIPYWSK